MLRRSLIALACLLSACASPPPAALDSKDKKAWVEQSQARFDALGPFVVEFAVEGAEPVEMNGRPFIRNALAVDIANRRLHWGGDQEAEGRVTTLWVLLGDGSNTYVRGLDGSYTKIASGPLLESVLKAIPTLDRELGRILGDPVPDEPPFAPRPFLSIGMDPEKKGGGQGHLTLGLMFSGVGRCSWLTRILKDPSVQGSELPGGVQWESAEGWRMLIDPSTGFLKSYEVRNPDGSSMGLSFGRPSRGPLPAGAAFPERYETRHLTPEEAISFYNGFFVSSCGALRGSLASGRYPEEVLEAALTVLAGFESQMVALQLRRQAMIRMVKKALDGGVRAEELASGTGRTRDDFAKAVSKLDPQLRETVHHHLARLRDGLIEQLTSPEMGRDRLEALRAIFDRACRPEKLDAVGPVGPVMTGGELFDEALTLLQPIR
jgi:hypothetical protein